MASDMVERIFRVGDKPNYGKDGIPWSVIAPHERRAQWNHGQSLKRLHERGGLVWSEAAAILEDRDWRPMDRAEAKAVVLARVDAALQESSHVR